MTSIPFRQAVELQHLILNDARKEDLKPVARATIARAFCELEETKRKLKMRPLPKPVDATNYRKSRGRNTPPPAFIPIAIPESSQVESQESTSNDTQTDTPILPEAGSDQSKNVA